MRKSWAKSMWCTKVWKEGWLILQKSTSTTMSQIEDNSPSGKGWYSLGQVKLSDYKVFAKPIFDVQNYQIIYWFVEIPYGSQSYVTIDNFIMRNMFWQGIIDYSGANYVVWRTRHHYRRTLLQHTTVLRACLLRHSSTCPQHWSWWEFEQSWLLWQNAASNPNAVEILGCAVTIANNIIHRLVWSPLD